MSRGGAVILGRLITTLAVMDFIMQQITALLSVPLKVIGKSTYRHFASLQGANVSFFRLARGAAFGTENTVISIFE